MITCCFTTSAWLQRPQVALALLERVVNEAVDDSLSVSLDLPTVLREPAHQIPSANFAIKEIDVRDWVNETLTEGGVINIEVVRRQAVAFRPDEVVILKAVGFLPSLIHSLLTHLHVGMYSASVWPKAIGVVCDDAQIFQVSPALANTFYLRPSIIVDVAVQRIVRSQVRKAHMLRRFSLQPNFFQKLYRDMVNKLWAREDKKFNAKLGWKWEE